MHTQISADGNVVPMYPQGGYVGNAEMRIAA